MEKIKIAYFDFSGGNEAYSIDPVVYGGGSIFGRWAKENLNESGDFEFYIFGHKNCFKDLSRLRTENNSHCLSLDQRTLDKIRYGEKIEQVLPLIKYFDIVMHHNVLEYLVTDKKQVIWCPFGKSEDAHPLLKYIFCFRKNQIPRSNKQNIYPVMIGSEVPSSFVENEKRDYVFCCYRHDEQTNSIEVAKNCLKHGIKGYFAGPIYGENGNYKLLDYIDNKTTFYLGIIPDEQKTALYKGARLCPFIYERNPGGSFSVVDSLSFGSPILVPKDDLRERKNSKAMFDGLILPDEQFLKSVIEENETGFFYNGENFLECFEKAKHANQKKCWEKSVELSKKKMIELFSSALKEVVKD